MRIVDTTALAASVAVPAAASGEAAVGAGDVCGVEDGLCVWEVVLPEEEADLLESCPDFGVAGDAGFEEDLAFFFEVGAGPRRQDV